MVPRKKKIAKAALQETPKRGPGQPRKNTRQLTLRVPGPALDALGSLADKRNSGSDFAVSPIGVTDLVNVAIRDFLCKHGHESVYGVRPEGGASG